MKNNHKPLQISYLEALKAYELAHDQLLRAVEINNKAAELVNSLAEQA